MKISQFDVWLVNLNPTKGSEQSGERPCIILQTNASRNYGATTIIAPFTTKNLNKLYPFEVKIQPSRQNGLKENSKIKLEQIRAIDKTRLLKKLGELEKKTHDDILNSLKIIFEFEGEFI